MKLLDLSQGNKSGADFMREVEALATGCEQSLAENFFLHHLVHKQLSKAYHNALNATLGKKVRTANYAELKEEIIFLLYGTDTTMYRSNNYNKDHNNNKNDSHNKKNGKNANKPDKDSKGDKPCDICGLSNHTTSQHRPKSNKPNTETKTPLSEVTCHKCKQKGHYANRCPNPRVEDNPQSNTFNKAKVEAKIRVL